MNQTVYPYTQGDLLAHPQTYQYSDYLGASFLEAWKKNRNTAIAALEGPVPPPPPMENGFALKLINLFGIRMEI